MEREKMKSLLARAATQLGNGTLDAERMEVGGIATLDTCCSSDVGVVL